MRIVEAPAELCGPLRTDRRLAPPFRVRVDAHYCGCLDFLFTVKAYIIDSEAAACIHEWVPPEFQDDMGLDKAQVTEFKGEVCMTHHFKAAASTALHPRAGDGDDGCSSWARAGAGPAAAPPGLEACCSHEFVFTDLRLARPSRMKPFYVVFAASVLDTDLTFVCWKVPSIAICRTDQYENACKVLGLPTGATAARLAASAAPRPSMPAWRQALLAAAAAQQQQQQKLQQQLLLQDHPLPMQTPLFDDRLQGLLLQEQRQRLGMLQRQLQGKQTVPTGRLASWLQQQQQPCVDAPQSALIPLLPEDPAHVSQRECGAGSLHMSLSNASVRRQPPAAKEEQVQQHQHPQPPPLPAQQAPQHPQLWLRQLARSSSGGSDDAPAPAAEAGTPAAAATAAAEPLSHGAAPAPPLGPTGGRPLAAPDPGDDAATVAAAAAAASVRRVPRPPSAAALRALLLASYGQLGFARPLCPDDLSSLQECAGFSAGGPAGDAGEGAIEDGGATRREWEGFLTAWVETLSLMKLIYNLWDMAAPTTLVSGPAVGRAAVAAALRPQPPGTFLCRVSLGQPGSLIVSCRAAAEHPQADADGVVHVAVPAALLRRRRADSWLRALPGATHALDVATGARFDKRQLLEGDYVRVAEISAAAAAAAVKKAACGDACAGASAAVGVQAG